MPKFYLTWDYKLFWSCVFRLFTNRFFYSIKFIFLNFDLPLKDILELFEKKLDPLDKFLLDRLRLFSSDVNDLLVKFKTYWGAFKFLLPYSWGWSCYRFMVCWVIWWSNMFLLLKSMLPIEFTWSVSVASLRLKLLLCSSRIYYFIIFYFYRICKFWTFYWARFPTIFY